MITLRLDWREVLWWMQGGMAGSHLRWSVYEDMVNRVWPQCDEQERRNVFLIMRRDLGSYWRPDGWNGHSHMRDKGEGPWKPAAAVLTYSDDPSYDPAKCITDLAPWTRFRQVLARFNPDEQYAVTMRVENSDALDQMLRLTPPAAIISQPSQGDIRKFAAGKWPKGKPLMLSLRTYLWEGQYRIDWSRRCAEDLITNIEHLDIPDTGEM